MKRDRLDKMLVAKGLISTRSQAESWIRLGEIKVDGRVVTKPGMIVGENAVLELMAEERYVSRAGLKLASVADIFKLDFAQKIVLDIGSSTGGFTDYALQHGASRVVAVDVGTDQLHASLRGDERVDLHEKTDIRNVYSAEPNHLPSTNYHLLTEIPDIVVMDLSFISLRDILPHVAKHLVSDKTQIVAMLKPQFEAGKNQVNKGVIKNEAIRRKILHEFESWARQYFVIKDKRDSGVSGAKGNQERFYLLNTLR
jgi:23S rRNA (cytidine1920-2'-O)/16S rRNA (cytidine1409-2'-O)-methyltransferase